MPSSGGRDESCHQNIIGWVVSSNRGNWVCVTLQNIVAGNGVNAWFHDLGSIDPDRGSGTTAGRGGSLAGSRSRSLAADHGRLERAEHIPGIPPQFVFAPVYLAATLRPALLHSFIAAGSPGFQLGRADSNRRRHRWTIWLEVWNRWRNWGIARCLVFVEKKQKKLQREYRVNSTDMVVGLFLYHNVVMGWTAKLWTPILIIFLLFSIFVWKKNNLLSGGEIWGGIFPSNHYRIGVIDPKWSGSLPGFQISVPKMYSPSRTLFPRVATLDPRPRRPGFLATMLQNTHWSSTLSADT
jgi:hypothetical protein